MTRTMKTLLRTLAVAALALPMTASFAWADEAADVAAIEAIWDRYEGYVVAGDPDGWLTLWDKEGIQLPPGTPMRGYEVIAEEERWNPGDFTAMEINPREIVILGDYGYAMGNYWFDFPAGEGEQGHFEGKFMTILHRQDDGSWRIFRDIFNADSQ